MLAKIEPVAKPLTICWARSCTSARNLPSVGSQAMRGGARFSDNGVGDLRLWRHPRGFWPSLRGFACGRYSRIGQAVCCERPSGSPSAGANRRRRPNGYIRKPAIDPARFSAVAVSTVRPASGAMLVTPPNERTRRASRISRARSSPSRRPARSSRRRPARAAAGTWPRERTTARRRRSPHRSHERSPAAIPDNLDRPSVAGAADPRSAASDAAK